MADNLPLLPEKEAVCAVCADVRSVFRGVFRESKSAARVNSIGLRTECDVADAVEAFDPIEKLSVDNTALHERELLLRGEHARRLAKDILPNIYQLHSQRTSRLDRSEWKKDVDLLERTDLRPTLQRSALGDGNLWVKNILNRSSGDLETTMKITGPESHPLEPLHTREDSSLRSISFGEVVPKLPPQLLPSSLSTRVPDYIICIPQQLKFINFSVGYLHTQTLRLINVSKFEMRLSIRPPKHRELDVQLCSRLVVTSGSAAEIKIRFRPEDVRVLRDRLLVRVHSGQILIVPIACYMEPPTLEIIVPNVQLQPSSPVPVKSARDVLDLGARLLGDVHRTAIVLKCGERHASFFLLSEDAWLEYSVEVAINIKNKTPMYGVTADGFFVTPVRWGGGGAVHGLAVCCADASGLHTATLRILCSTAIVRPLHLVADALMFSPKHITLKAQDKNYDICSEDDPACEYYVHLGTGFPSSTLFANVTIINHSPLSYNYYWSVRPWGVCSCWERFGRSEEGEDDDDDLCPGALHTKLKAKQKTEDNQAGGDASLAVRVQRARGCLDPRSDNALCVRVPDIGDSLGLRRAVLMLILTDIPKESFPKDYDPMIVNVNVIDEEPIPGVSTRRSREVCEVVFTEVEVWWEVVPVRFVLDPPLLLLPHSRRVKTVAVTLRATQLCGVSSVRACFETAILALDPPQLLPGHSYFASAVLPLKELPNEFPETSHIRLKSESCEWSVSCAVSRWCSERSVALQPARSWLGVLPPGVTVTTDLHVLNNTHQHIYWWGSCHRWCRERGMSRACEGRPPCVDCYSRTCTCLLLTPSRGALHHAQQVSLLYRTNAPDSDGCVATLVRTQRTAADTSSVHSAPGSSSRAALVAYRVLAPRLALSVLPCGGDKQGECAGCALDPGATALLRPKSALTVGDTSCCRLRVTNITPIPTRVTWEPGNEEKDALRVVFIPNDFEVRGHSQVTIMVTLEARRVVDRRLFARRARVLDAYRPLYLLIDAAISGIEVSVEFPIGGEERTESYVCIKMIQRENVAKNISTQETLSSSPTELFAEDDRKRTFQKVSSCTCLYKMVYIPPSEEAKPPREDPDDTPKVEIVEEPPPLSRVCPCSGRCKPALPENVEPYCIQFVGLPLRKVRSRTVTLRNVCRLKARWRCVIRRQERAHTRTVHVAEEDQWSEAVRHPGFSLSCSPSRGTVDAARSVSFTVSVFADTWGLYCDRILLQIEELEPLVIDVWVEAVGPPLSFTLRPQETSVPVLWITRSDPCRVVHVSNTARADLSVFSYIVKEHNYPQERLPFRLYIRLYDVPPRVCPCLSAFSSNLIDEESLRGSVCSEEMDTGVEIFLAADYGLQDETFFKVEQRQLSMKAGESASVNIHLLRHHEEAPFSTLMLRSVPVAVCGDHWHRPQLPPQLVSLREAERHSDLKTTSCEVRVTLCALEMPPDDVLRVRKKLKLQNVGEGPLETTARTEAPWRLGLSRNICDAHCMESDRSLAESLKVQLPPRSCIEMVVELNLYTKDVWPKMGDYYPSRTVRSTTLCFFDYEEVMLLSLPLILDLDMPVLVTEPKEIDFGFVSDGCSRKSYFTVKHTSASAVIESLTMWSGDNQFRLWPPSLRLLPGASERVYIQFTANWVQGSVSSGAATVRTRAGGAWCRAVVQARARSARTASHTHHDHTDDDNLLP